MARPVALLGNQQHVGLRKRDGHSTRQNSERKKQKNGSQSDLTGTTQRIYLTDNALVQELDLELTSQQLAKFFQAQPGIAHNSAHREGIDRIMARNCQDARSIRHHNMSALAQNAETCLFQCSHGFEMVDPRKF